VSNQDSTEGVPGLLWISNGTVPFESLWMAVQRFMYLNDLSGNDFYYLLEGRNYPDPTASPRGIDVYRRLLATQAAEIARLFARFVDIDPGILENRMGRYARFMEPDRPLRFCPECLAHCFHSPIFQFPALSRCPFHLVDLQLACRFCGNNLSTFGFIPANHLKPFCCTACGTSYVPDNKAASRVLFGLPEASQAFTQAFEVVTRMTLVDVTSAKALIDHDMESDRYARFHCHALYAATKLDSPKPDWLIGLESEVTVRPISSPRRNAQPEGCAESASESVTLDVHLHSLHPVLKSVNRYLSRKVRSVCGHRYPKSFRHSNRSVPQRGNIHFLALDRRACPCCATLAWWRANLGIYFKLYEWASKLPLKPRLSEERAWLENYSPLSPEQLVATALDVFASLAVKMAYRVVPSTNLLSGGHGILYADVSDRRTLMESWHALRDQLKQQRRGDGYLELPFQVFSVDLASLRCMDANGEPCSLSYSVRNAMDALSECHAVRQAGLLWNFSGYEFSHSSGRSKDVWYQDVDRTTATREWWDAYNEAFLLRTSR
jgi:hypothetical protein